MIEAPAQTVFQKTVGFYGSVNAMQMCADSGFAYCGNSNADFGNLVMARYSAAGVKMWQREIGTTAIEAAHDFVQTADGGFVVAGKHWDSEHGMLVVKLDSLGNQVWTRKLSRSYLDQANSICATADGGLVIAGESEDQSGTSTAIVTKLSATGSLLWSRTISGFKDGGYSIVRLPNGRFAMTGLTDVGQVNNIGIVCFDSAAVYWSYAIGTPGVDSTSFNHQLIITADSCLAFSGTTYSIPSHGGDFFIAKINAAGVPQWMRSYGSASEEFATSLVATSNGILLAGYTLSGFNTIAEPLLVKMQLNGLPAWAYSYPGNSYDPFLGITLKAGDEVMAGGTSATSGSLAEASLFKLTANGTACRMRESTGVASFLSGWYGFPVTISTTTIFVFPVSLASSTIQNENTLCACSGSVPVSASLPVQSMCYGNTTTLSHSFQPGFSYSLFRNGVSYSTGSTGFFSLTQGGYYKVVQQSGCASDTSNTVHLTVNTNPTVSISSSGKTKICSGQSVTLSAISTLGVSYQWQRNGVNVPLATLPSYNANQTGDYKVRVTNTGTGCSKTSTVVNVTVNPLPPAVVTANGPTTFCNGDSVELVANSGAGYAYQWRKNGNPVAGATALSFTVKQPGTYKVKVTDVTGCTQLSSGVPVSVPCREFSVPEIHPDLYPNPASAEFYIDLPADVPSIFAVIDLTGRVIKSGVLKNGKNIVSVEGLSSGLYIVRIFSDGIWYTDKVQIEAGN